MVSRAERSAFSDWWWTVDRLLLAALAILILAGLVFLMAGGPPVAERLGLSTFHFVNRQVFYIVPAFLVMIVVSFFSPRHVRRVALLVYVVAMVVIIFHLWHGAWASIRTLGYAKPSAHPLKRRIAAGLATAVWVGFILVPIGVFMGIIR